MILIATLAHMHTHKHIDTQKIMHGFDFKTTESQGGIRGIIKYTYSLLI